MYFWAQPIVHKCYVRQSRGYKQSRHPARCEGFHTVSHCVIVRGNAQCSSPFQLQASNLLWKTKGTQRKKTLTVELLALFRALIICDVWTVDIFSIEILGLVVVIIVTLRGRHKRTFATVSQVWPFRLFIGFA